MAWNSQYYFFNHEDTRAEILFIFLGLNHLISLFPLPVGDLPFCVAANVAREHILKLASGNLLLQKPSEPAIFEPERLHSFIRKSASVQPPCLRDHSTALSVFGSAEAGLPAEALAQAGG